MNLCDIKLSHCQQQTVRCPATRIVNPLRPTQQTRTSSHMQRVASLVPKGTGKEKGNIVQQQREARGSHHGSQAYHEDEFGIWSEGVDAFGSVRQACCQRTGIKGHPLQAQHTT